MDEKLLKEFMKWFNTKVENKYAEFIEENDTDILSKKSRMEIIQEEVFDELFVLVTKKGK